MSVEYPLVSYILCVYNGESTLDETLKSLLSQRNAEMEIIAVNDGSTDKSLSILKRYAKRDSRIKIINQPNLGLSAARNRGIRQAKGKYIASAAQDDIYLPDKTHDQVEFMKKKGLDFSFTGVKIINNDGKIINHPDTELYNRKLWPWPLDLIQFILYMPVCSSSFMCRRECYDKLRWNPALIIFADKDIFSKMYRKYRGGKLPKISLYRRYHFRGETAEYKRKYPRDFIYFEHRTSLVSSLIYDLIPSFLIPGFGQFLTEVRNLVKLEKNTNDLKAMESISMLYGELGFGYLAELIRKRIRKKSGDEKML